MGRLRRQALRAARGLSAPSPKQARGFPPEYKRLRSPVRRLGWLNGDECKAAVNEGRLQQNQVEKEKDALNGRMKAVGPRVPSPTRLDDVWAGEEFPPKPDDPANTPAQAKWLLNPEAEREVLWPAYWIGTHYKGRGARRKPNGTATYDLACFEDQCLARSMGIASKRGTESPTAVALERLEQTGGIIVESKLPTEDKGVLAHQLEHYNATGDMRAFAV